MNTSAQTLPSARPLKALYDIPAPAKLNLFLHITGRRPDGHHLLQSVFMLIDWCDTLHFEVRTDGLISRADITEMGQPDGAGKDGDANKPQPDALPAEDLTVRAARALKAATGTTLGVHISLQKRIPSQAGMGGGSSDAASCLLALQRLWGVRLPAADLATLALSLGADVPFFLSGGHAWVEGIGEKITPIKLPPARFLVVKPPVGLSTQRIFSAEGLKRDTVAATIQGFAANAEDRIFQYGCNDLQPVAETMCPQIGQSLDWLKAHHMKGRMTGSGSAVFAQLPPGVGAVDLPASLSDASELPGNFGEWVVRPCKSLEVHPLAGW